MKKQGCEQLTLYRGGFPCQPHSKAGKRKASSDERDLWPEMRRVISEIRPQWVVAENVRGLLSSEYGRFFRGILRDFSGMGFDVGWCCLRAADFGAIHRRERMGIIAHARGGRRMDCTVEINTMDGSEQTLNDTNTSVESWGRKCNVFEPKLLRDINGVPYWMDRIKCLGNAVVPQQFYLFFKLIHDIEEEQ